MDNFIQRFSVNTLGTDYAVGDIHGSFSRLQQELDLIDFDSNKDRLFSLGDLIDRGPESELALEWLNKPWFHAIQGNHEAMLLEVNPDDKHWRCTDHFNNGGEWFYDLTKEKQQEFRNYFKKMPYIIQVQTRAGDVGLVHADFPHQDWRILEKMPVTALDLYHYQWSRERINQPNLFPIDNIRAVIHGHTPVYGMVVMNNIYYIDTAGWLGGDGHFTLLNLDTLQPANPAAQQAFITQ